MNEIWFFLFQKIDIEPVKWASRVGTSVLVKAFTVYVIKCLKPFFSRTTYQYCKYSHASKLLV